MNSITAVLRKFTEQDSNGCYKDIVIFSKSGKEFRGSLVNWVEKNTPNLVTLTTTTGAKVYIESSNIEAVLCGTDHNFSI